MQPILQCKETIVRLRITSCIHLRKTRLDNGWKIHITSSSSKILMMEILEQPIIRSLVPFNMNPPMRQLQAIVTINAMPTSKKKPITGTVPPTLWCAVLTQHLNRSAPILALMQIYSTYRAMVKFCSVLLL